ncbi:aryl-sulfate sulfotransferase [Lentibacillus sp. CBA3610]|uniref:aryl-sulfate sulfotransferase n=1 Tax=Lentibacillus sp. CBA3610 TaxID=2518176 RepID=UPI001595AED4|nr:aryl-sulfate sulfotransferase [Lentibacillus sp. CBA3610]QKY70612.1 aryl-sulfate sulfotransferase [Lentibacillus sp. CBA3610]
MRKTLATFVVLAIIMIAFFVILEYTGDAPDELAKGAGQKVEAAQNSTISFKPDGEVEQLSTSDTRRIREQEKVEQALQKEYDAGSYSLQNPFVKHDPYGVAPLTALTMFETDDPVRITVTVKGKDEYSDVSHSIDAYKTKHSIPVLGLYPDYENMVTIEATNEAGDTAEHTFTVETDPLPDDFLTNEAAEAHPEKMENGMTFIIPSTRHAYAVDHNADVRWYSTLWNSHIFKRLDNGNVLYITKEEGQDEYNEVLEMDMLGKVYNSYLIQLDDYEKTNVVHHEIIELPNGNLLATVHDMASPYIEDEMIEIDRETGETVRDFSFRDLFPEDFYEDYGNIISNTFDNGVDWFHQNAIWYVEKDDSILVSSRHQDLIMKLSYPDGEIDWILADHEKWPDAYDKYLLEPVNDDFKFPAGPHAPMTMPDFDNNEATNDYLLFDNNVVVTRGKDPLSGDFSQGVQYRINPEEMTVEEVWQFGRERGEDFYSRIVGDADYLEETGNRLLTSGYIEAEEGMNSRIVEVNDKQPADVTYELVVSSFEKKSHKQAYRAERMPLTGTGMARRPLDE